MEWVQLILSLAGIIGLIFFMFYFLKKLNKGAVMSGRGKMRIIDRAAVGRDSMLVVVSVCGRLMLVGVSAGRIEKICDLDATEEEYFSGESVQKSVSFSEIMQEFSKNLKPRQSQKQPGETPNVEEEPK